METVYRVIAEPPVSPPEREIVDAIKDAMIDLRVVFDDGNPFGALGFMPATAGNDQENIERLKDDIPFKMEAEKAKSKKDAEKVGDVIQRMKDSTAAPEIPGGKPY